MPAIDYARVREQVSLRQVLNLIHYQAHRWFAGRCYGPCPMACSTYPRCCSFEFSRNLWMCHRCKRGGNQLDLYAHWSDMGLFVATRHLCDHLGIELPWLAPNPTNN